MKKFRINSIIFISVIAIIFCCNVYYLSQLYTSIRNMVEKDVMTALADADLDELWIRADRAKAGTTADLEAQGYEADTVRHGESSVYQDSDGSMVTTSKHPDGTVSTEAVVVEGENSFTNRFINTVGKQFHGIMDPYVNANLAVLDSVLTMRLNNRFIYPEFVAVEIIDNESNVIQVNPKNIDLEYDEFVYSFNPDAGLSYRAYITPLTRHVLSQMMGIIITIFLLMVAFSIAFWYLFHTVSKLRTIEEMKDDFVSNMTHELKTPIAIAYSANDALLNYDTTNDPEKKTAYLNIAIKQLKRLGELVENILAMSMGRRKTMTLKPERIDLPELVAEISEAQKMRADKEIEIDIHSKGSIYVTADKSHLSNVLNNLIDNAIKYSSDSVAINITMDSETIEVADNGIGIPAKSLPYIFDKFYRVPHGNRQDVRGYGIGLYYVKHILNKMGWRITVKSEEGKGSTFTIKFDNHES
ncbi:MAG: HAMP domain-containing histidine kinase [Muribaculum sp.]|nr:HAMP domain-containing histidine kinase [Muribaculum sp.]